LFYYDIDSVRIHLYIVVVYIPRIKLCLLGLR